MVVDVLARASRCRQTPKSRMASTPVAVQRLPVLELPLDRHLLAFQAMFRLHHGAGALTLVLSALEL